MTTPAAPPASFSDSSEDATLAAFGYRQNLDRAVGRFGSFSIAFSLISATTAVFSTFSFGLITAGPAFIWTFPIAAGVLAIWVVIAADLSSKIPLSGYAYQWTSRLVSPGLGWFTALAGLVGFITGMTAVSYTLANYFEGLVGIEQTTGRTVLFTLVVIAVAVSINIVGVRLVARLNNIGVGLELAVTLGGIALVLIAAFIFGHSRDHQDFSFLFTKGTVTSPYLTAWFTATLTGLFGLIGVEAAADVAEETHNARIVIPKMMFFALGSAVTIEFIMYMAFLLAVPDVKAATNSATPVQYVMAAHLGQGFTDVYVALALVNIFGCVLASVLVIGRLLYALGRDRMLPASSFFAKVSPHTRVPVNAIISCGVLAGLFTLTALASTQVLIYIEGMATLGYFSVYILTTAGLLTVFRKAHFPRSVSGGFDLGPLRGPVYVLGMIAFCIVTYFLCTLNHAARINGLSMLGVLVVGGLWYLAYLRPRIADGTVGPPAAISEGTAASRNDASPR